MIALALALGLAQPIDPPDRVTLRLEDGASAAVRQVALRLDRELETVVPWIETWTGRLLPRNQRLVLYLYDSIDGYREALRKEGIQGFENAGCVTLWRTNESHLVVQPRAEAAYLEVVDHLPELTLQLAVHELVHQFFERTDGFPTDHQPLWYSEGTAELYSWRALERLGTGGSSFLLDDLRERLVRGLAAGTLAPLDEFFTDAFPTEAVNARGLAYAQAGSLLEFFQDERNRPWHGAFSRFERQLHTELERPRRRSPARWSRQRVDRELRRVLGGTEALEAAWRRSLASSGAWTSPKRSAEWSGTDLVVSAFSWGTEALAMAPGTRDPSSLELLLEVSVPTLGEPEFFVVFAADPTGEERLELRVRADGEVLLAERRGGRWTTWTGVHADALDEPSRRSLAIRGDATGFHVDYAGERLFHSRPPETFTPAGSHWGVGTLESVLVVHDQRTIEQTPKDD